MIVATTIFSISSFLKPCNRKSSDRGGSIISTKINQSRNQLVDKGGGKRVKDGGEQRNKEVVREGVKRREKEEEEEECWEDK